MVMILRIYDIGRKKEVFPSLGRLLINAAVMLPTFCTADFNVMLKLTLPAFFALAESPKRH